VIRAFLGACGSAIPAKVGSRSGASPVPNPAKALCELLSGLLEDADFWGQLFDATAKDGEELQVVVGNLDVLLDSEKELLLGELGWYDEEVERLFRDMKQAVELLGEEPGGGSYEDFRSSLDVLRKRVCALGRGDQTTDFRLKARRALKIGILIVGGAVVAVVDAVTIPHHWNPYLAKASIDLGAALFKKGVLVLASEE